MLRPTQIAIPTLVRVKDRALDRLGLYLHRGARAERGRAGQQGAASPLPERVRASLKEHGVEPAAWVEVRGQRPGSPPPGCSPTCRRASPRWSAWAAARRSTWRSTSAFLGRLPYYAVPTSLSNDGFCSPQSSLTIRGKRRSLPAALPFGVVIDTAVCRDAPRILTLSGVGDLVAKFTAVRDWKLAFHATGEPVDDFAALLSDGSIHAYLSHPAFDLEGIRLLATALMLNGIAMEICGSSRPASGSEHLISHALDATSRPAAAARPAGRASRPTS